MTELTDQSSGPAGEPWPGAGSPAVAACPVCDRGPVTSLLCCVSFSMRNVDGCWGGLLGLLKADSGGI